MSDKKEVPITWFPSSTDRKNWADEIARVQSHKLKEQQAMHSAEMAKLQLEFKMESFKRQQADKKKSQAAAAKKKK